MSSFSSEKEKLRNFFGKKKGVFSASGNCSGTVYSEPRSPNFSLTLRSARISRDDEMTLEKFVSAHVSSTYKTVSRRSEIRAGGD